MKKIIIKIFILFLSIIFPIIPFLKPEIALARCSNVTLPDFVIGDCNIAQYDCSRSSALSQTSCVQATGCHEEVHFPVFRGGIDTIVNYCFPLKGNPIPASSPQPLPLMTPTPCNEYCTQWRGPVCIQSTGIETALGCFPTDPKEIINWVLKYAIYLSGGIGFLLMAWSSIQMMMSGGDPEKLKNAQGMFGSAVIGILIIVFSLFILKFIGAVILKIPGWG